MSAENKVRIAVQVFKNGQAVTEKVARVKAATSQEAVDKIFKVLRIDYQYRFLGDNGFVLPTPSVNDYLLFNGGVA